MSSPQFNVWKLSTTSIPTLASVHFEVSSYRWNGGLILALIPAETEKQMRQEITHTTISAYYAWFYVFIMIVSPILWNLWCKPLLLPIKNSNILTYLSYIVSLIHAFHFRHMRDWWGTPLTESVMSWDISCFLLIFRPNIHIFSICFSLIELW